MESKKREIVSGGREDRVKEIKKRLKEAPLEIKTFAYSKKETIPDGTWFIIDCRKLENPWKHGLSDPEEIRVFLMTNSKDEVDRIQTKARIAKDKGIKKIAFGCAHGRHRSVAMATLFKDGLEGKKHGIAQYFNPVSRELN